MSYVKPLPDILIARYRGWKATKYAESAAWYRRLATEGQRPRVMIIACCDSRVHVGELFEAEQGEFFIHRNIANLVPPFTPDGDHHGTSAAIEYAVTALNVANVVVLGHSTCGGIQGCLDMCQGRAPELEQQTSFVGRWMDLLRPTVEALEKTGEEFGAAELEKDAIKTSLANLMTFPFVQSAVESGELALHGLWHDIGEGGLEWFNADANRFDKI